MHVCGKVPLPLNVALAKRKAKQEPGMSARTSASHCVTLKYMSARNV